MPLDRNFDFKRRCVGWERKVSFLPRRCFYTNKLIWLKSAYRGLSFITGPGETLFEERWVDSKQYLLLKISGVI